MNYQQFVQRLMLSASVFFISQKIFSIELGGGIAAVSEGDDHSRPASSLYLGWNDHWFHSFYVYGRQSKLVDETTFLLGTNYKFNALQTWPSIQAATGLALALQKTIVQPEPETSIENSNLDPGANHTGFNLGGVFGIYWKPPKANIWGQLSWESHLYLAGDAGIFLSTARNQMLGLSMGVRF